MPLYKFLNVRRSTKRSKSASFAELNLQESPKKVIKMLKSIWTVLSVGCTVEDDGEPVTATVTSLKAVVMIPGHDMYPTWLQGVIYIENVLISQRQDVGPVRAIITNNSVTFFRKI